MKTAKAIEITTISAALLVVTALAMETALALLKSIKTTKAYS